MENAIIVTNELGEILATEFGCLDLLRVSHILSHMGVDFELGEITEDGRTIIHHKSLTKNTQEEEI